MEKVNLKHIQADSCNGDCGGSCMICCCAVCKVCGGFEGSLTTHCVGRRLTEEESDKIYEEGHNYVNGEWIILDDKHPMAKNPEFG